MNIGFIGAGKVGTSFGQYLQTRGLPLNGYYSRHYQSAVVAAGITQSQAFESLERLVEDSIIIGITTSDDQIEKVALELSWILQAQQGQSSKTPHRLPIVFHMSGSLSVETLKPLADMGCNCFTLHPLQSIASVEQGSAAFDSAYFALETVNSDSEEAAALIIQHLQGPVIHIKPGEKPRYHLAACLASNYLAGLLNEAALAMMGAGFTKEEGLSALMPLVEGTLSNIKTMGLEKALTGPIARGDVHTVMKHLAQIEGESALTRVYKTMGSATLHLAQQELLKDEQTISALEHLFREDEQA